MRRLVLLLAVLAGPARALEIEGGLTHESLTKGRPDWDSVYLEAAHDFAPRQTLYGVLREVDRFDLRDTELAVGYYHPFSSRWVGQIEASASPQHNVLARSSIFGQLLAFLLPLLIIVVLFLFLFRRAQGGAGQGAFSFGKSRAKRVSPDAPKVNFKDVAGAFVFLAPDGEATRIDATHLPFFAADVSPPKGRLAQEALRAAVQDMDAVRLLWEAALRSGDIPGAYWATLTHWASTPELMKAAFADVHMLSHLVGAANRADIRRLAALEAERAELALKVEKQQTQLREAIVTRDATIRRLNGMLAEKIAQERSAAPHPRPQAQVDESVALRELVAALQQRLATEEARRERTEQRHAMLRATLSEVQTALRDTNAQVQQLNDELAAAEAQFSPPQDSDVESQRPLPACLKGARLLYVGGRHGHIHRIRAFVEDAQAEFLHHDGGVEDRKGLLAGIVSRADAIFFPVDCVSHDTVAVVKRLCRQTGKPYLPLRSTSLTSFIAALRRFEWSGLEGSSLT